MRKISFLSITAFCFLAACSKPGQNADQPHAQVLLRDGSAISGTVAASSASEITVKGDDGVSHTIPMKQVKSVSYDDQQAAGSAASAPPASTPDTAAAPSSAQPAPAAQSAPPTEAHPDHYHPPQNAIRTKTYRLPAGTRISVRTEETIDSKRAVEGQTFASEVSADVVDANGDVVIPRGSNAQIVIKSASKGGRFRGAADLVLDLQSVSVEGQQYQLDTADLTQTGKQGVGANRRTAEYGGGGAAIGAIIGAIAGGGKGAAIGAGAGGGAGVLTQVLTKGGSIRVPVESLLTFELDRPLRVVAAQ